MNSNSPPLTPQTGQSSGRPYRSKRHPPCDQCRQKKLRCEANRQTACQRCQTSGAICSFTRMHSSPSSHVPAISSAHNSPYPPESILPTVEPPVVTSTPQAYLPEAFAYDLRDRPALQQTVQTLDLLQGVSAQVIGVSGECDPWLLRHCKFDNHGFLLSHQVHFRNAGGVPFQEKVPVHFLVTEDALYESAKSSSSSSSSSSSTRTASARDALNALVPVEYGPRLLALFLQHVFPSLPIVLQTTLTEPPLNLPVHLLAALYAISLPFAPFDEYLSVIYAYSPPPTEQLWRLTLDLILEEIHTPHLSVLQAGLLYLHKPPPQPALADTPFLWSLVGMLVGLAASLGLQFECRPMGVPLWERRLRRRLWWAIYAEDKWRALVLGRPPYLRPDEWDVTPLDGGDFECPPPERFLQFVRLSRIAEDIQREL